MLNTSIAVRPKFTGAYFDEKEAKKASTDRHKQVQGLFYGSDLFYINNDGSGRDLEQLQDLTQSMHHDDHTLPPHRQDKLLPFYDNALFLGRIAHLYSLALENFTFMNNTETEVD